MKTELILVGKTTDSHIAALTADYVDRIGHYLPFNVTILPSIRSRSSLSFEQQRQAEGEQILANVDKSDTLVLFDEHGKELTSMQLATWLEHKQMTAKRLLMVVGGPYGFSQQVYQRANEQLSLSRLTFSHQMVRLFVAEQIYRACTIIHGESYHHE